MSAKIEIIDHGWDKLHKELRELNTKTTKVGLFYEDRSADGTMSMPELGMIHEYGHGKIPKRSFMRSTASMYESTINGDMAEEIFQLYEGEGSADQILESIGKKYTEYTQEVIQELDSPALKQFTVDNKVAKGSPEPDNPLIDTGKMKKSVKYKIVRKR